MRNIKFVFRVEDADSKQELCPQSKIVFAIPDCVEDAGPKGKLPEHVPATPEQRAFLEMLNVKSMQDQIIMAATNTGLHFVANKIREAIGFVVPPMPPRSAIVPAKDLPKVGEFHDD